MLMAMETSLMQGLSSMVVGERQKNCEKFAQMLENREAVSDEVMKKIMLLTADSNVLIATKAMDCIETCSNQDRLQSLPLNVRNNVFDSLINRLADGKAQMRSKAKDVLSSIATKVDTTPLLEKFSTLISSRNVYLKRNIVQITMEIMENTAAEQLNNDITRLISIIGLTSVNDTDSGIKKAGLMLLRTALLHLGDGFQIILREAGAKADVLTKLNTSTATLSRTNSRPNIVARSLPVKEDVNDVFIDTPSTATPTENIADTPAAFDPRSWLSFLMENATLMDLKTETETQRVINGIEQDLRDQDDWQKRMEALISLRGIALGSLRESGQAGAYLRRLQDLLDVQLADPRSTITKECCRALTALSLRLKATCLSVVELCWPKVVKLLVSKTQLTAQAADIFVRVLIFSCEDSKVMSWFADLVRSKNSAHRRLGLEYLLLATARWPADIIDRFFPYMQSSLRLGLTDADSEARKVARLLFRLLQCSKLTSPRMKRMESELDSTAMKYLNSEEQSIVDLDYLMHLRSMSMEVSSKSKDVSMISVVAPLPAAPVMELIDDGMDWLDNALLDDEQDLNKSGNNLRRNTFATPAGAARGKTGGTSKRMSLAGPVRLLSQPSQAMPAAGDAIIDTTSISSANVGLSRPRRMSLAATAPAPMLLQATSQDMALLPATADHSLPPMTVEKENRRGSLMPGTAMMTTNNRRESVGALNNGPRRILQPLTQPLISASTHNLPAVEVDNVSVDKSTFVKPQVMLAAVKDTKVIAPQSNIEIFRGFLSTKGGLLKALEMYHKHLQADSTGSIEGSVVDMKFFSDSFESVLDGLVDTNTKLATVAVDILDILLPAQNKYPWIVSSYQCSAMIKFLFCGLVDGKPVIRDHIQRLLTTLRTHFPHAALFAATMTSLKDVPERAMAAAFQFAGAILPTSSEYFQKASQVGDFLMKMLYCLVEMKASPVAQLAGKRLVIKAIESHIPVFVKVIGGLALAQQTAIKSLLNSKLVVELETKLLLQAKKDKIAAVSSQQQQQQQQQTPPSEQRSALATQLLKKVEEVTTRLSPAAKCEDKVQIQPTIDEKTLEQVVLQACRSPSVVSPGFKADSPIPHVPFQAWSEPVFAAPLPSPQPVKTIEWIIDGLQQSCLSSQHQSAIEALATRIKIGDSSLFQDHTATIVLVILEALQCSHTEESKQDTSDQKKNVHESLLKKYRLLLKIFRSSASSSSQQAEDRQPAVTEEGARMIITAIFRVIRPVFPADIFHAQLMDFLAALLINLLRPAAIPSMVTALKEGIDAAVSADRDNFLSVLTAIRGFSVITSIILDSNGNRNNLDSLYVRSVCQEVTAFLMTTCLGHELAEIRQQSTLLLADMYRALGVEMLPWIESMTVMQRKVLMVYVHKTTAAAN